MGLFDSWNVKDYAIHLSSAAVAPGQMLSGNLVFTVTSEMSFRKVTLKVIGREYTHIQVSKSSGTGKHRRTSTHHYYGRRNFFKVHVTQLGMPKWGGTSWQGTLAAGTYNFPFAVRIPVDALPSMHVGGSNTASVQYYVKSKIDIPFGPDSDVSTPFVVTTAMPELQARSATPYFSPETRVPRTCCCCNSGHTTFTFSIERNLLILAQSAVGGGDLEGHITVNNSESKEHTKNIIVTLQQHTTFSAQGYSRIALTPLSSVDVATNLAKQHPGDHTFSFRIPLVPPPGELLPRAASFKGELISNTYLLTFSCDGDVLGQLFVNAASALDSTNSAAPVQSETVLGNTVPHGNYPRFLYAPPPNSEPQIPTQAQDVGPFAVTGVAVPPIPY